VIKKGCVVNVLVIIGVEMNFQLVIFQILLNGPMIEVLKILLGFIKENNRINSIEGFSKLSICLL
jgi:hypothetical protein